MITLQEWNEMSGKEQTLWLEENCKVNGFGRPRNPLFGVGINDSNYCTGPIIDGKQIRCPAYKSWRGIITRSYSAKEHARHPTYSGVAVCSRWHSFMNFRCWWIDHQVDGYQIDKDLLSNDGVYSPENCIFVPAWLNNFTIDRGAARGELPIGVSFNNVNGRFVAHCSNPSTGKQENVGYFDKKESAHIAWRARKLELALELKPKMDEIDPRIYPRVCEIINNAR